MIGVDRIDDARRLGRSGASVASIARDTGVSEPTVRKYLREPDLSERPPVVGRAPGSPLLEPFAGLVDSWLLEDRRCWFKRRHTARRVFDRLTERGFGGSYATVRRYVRRRGGELAAELDAREAQGVPAARPARRRVSGGLPRARRRRAGAGAGPTHSSAPPVSVRAGWGQGVFFSVAKRAKTR